MKIVVALLRFFTGFQGQGTGCIKRRIRQYRGSRPKEMRLGALVVLLYILITCPLSQAARSDGSLTLDGLQGQYAPQDPPDPGYIFVTPKRAPGNAKHSGTQTINIYPPLP